MLTSLAGNGSVLAVFTRFKRLRTFPNILLGNLALVDFLSVLINMPKVFLNNFVLESGQVEGKSSFSLVAASLQFGFVILNLASMIAIMLDRFLALSLDFRYHVWKTKKRAVVSAALLWLACSFLAVSTILPALDIESADYSIEEYRWLVFQKRKPYVCSIFGLFIVGAVILGIMTAFAIHQRKKKV